MQIPPSFNHRPQQVSLMTSSCLPSASCFTELSYKLGTFYVGGKEGLLCLPLHSNQKQIFLGLYKNVMSWKAWGKGRAEPEARLCFVQSPQTVIPREAQRRKCKPRRLHPSLVEAQGCFDFSVFLSSEVKRLPRIKIQRGASK